MRQSNRTMHNTTSRQSAIFLDRDGTLIEDVGILRKVEQIELFPDTLNALSRLQRKYMLFVVTNQSGVADGMLDIDEVGRIHHKLASMFTSHGVTIRDWYVCPHRKTEGCECHKPNPGLLLQASQAYGVDLASSFVIGDHPHDAVTGEELGVRGLYLLTGHGRDHRPKLPAGTPVFETIGRAADWILEDPGAKPPPTI